MIKAIKTRQLNSLHILLGAAAFGLSMLTSCYDYYEKDGEPFTSVTAQFSLSVSGKMGTRMSVAATQSDQAFQGMQDITLIPFIKSGDSEIPIVEGDRNVGTHATLEDLEEFEFRSNSKLYDVHIPAGTNAFLVYGRSKATTNGELTPTWGDYHTNEISFSPVQLVSSVAEGHAAGWTNDEETCVETGDNLIAYLNKIFDARWYTQETYPVLYGFYSMVKDMKAGSTASVQAFVQEIYDAIKTSTAYGVEAVLKDMLVADLDEEGNLPVPLPEKVTLPENCQGYPAYDLGLPEGTAVIEWVETETTKKFQAVTDKNNLGGMNVDVTKFVKPAELWYRTNSRINTDNSSRLTEYQMMNTWSGVLNTYAEQKSSVKTSTKSVAVRQQMQYAVGRLDVKLQAVDDANQTINSLVDKAGTVFDDFSKLPITGILVGQQRPVNFKFESTTDGESYTIYDSEVESEVNAEDFTHTLVLETPAEETVNVAIELQNNSGKNIVLDTKAANNTMVDQIVPNGCKFYLVGELNYANAKEGGPSHKKVFVQDEKTEVTFTVKDLKHGYYVIPPLSFAELEITLGTIPWKISTSAGISLDYNEE